jgi:hypothetical protein
MPYSNFKMTNTSRTAATCQLVSADVVASPEATTGAGHKVRARARLASRKAKLTLGGWLAMVTRGYTWATEEDRTASVAAAVETRDFIRETLAARAAEGDQFAINALRAHG